MTAFPGPSWAWPVGGHHALVYAVAGSDEALALAGLKNWLATHDIDSAAFREQRLLFAAFFRFGEALQNDPFHARLTGLQRLLWTRAQMAARQNLPSVLALEKAGIKVLFIKGAAMAALPYVSSRQRVSHDIDIVVSPADFPAAFELLSDDGWLASPGQSRLCLRDQLDLLRSVNMFRGRFGDIDLHSRPFHFSQGGGPDDTTLWSRARAGVLSGQKVLVPSAEDALALAIGHGGLDGHAHSDWLVDAARLAADEAIDWRLLLDILAARGLSAAGCFTLGYLASELGLAVPEDALARLAASAAASPADYLSVMAQMRPRDRNSAFGELVRGVAKWRRKRADGRVKPAPARPQQFLGARISGAADAGTDAYVTSAAVPDRQGARFSRVRLVLQIGPQPVARRLEFELNTATGHLARFTVRLLRPRNAPFRVIVKGEAQIPPIGDVFVEARPSRQLREITSPEQRASYAAVPFMLVRADFS